jgi:structure-specific endonuclease subunit SLX1
MDNWECYIIENRGYTYVGVSNNVERRLRAHNGEIKGGAKYTTSKGNGWKHICIIRGFPTKIESLQFEWALKHVPPRNAGGITNRIKKLILLLNKNRWTKNSPLAETMPITIEWVDKTHKPQNIYLPVYISELMK